MALPNQAEDGQSVASSDRGLAGRSISVKGKGTMIGDIFQMMKLLFLVATVQATLNPHPFLHMSTPEMIAANGYPAERHPVITEDGYILELHRIPYGIKDSGSKREGRPPVLLQHCLLCSSADFVMNTPDKALAYILADAGYDVWMGNVRGNTYSRKHITLNPRQKEFWLFSWDHMAQYDIPATIDHILNTTNTKEIYYVGFSMGTTVYWAMLNNRPEYTQKIRFMVALGPVAYVSNAKGPLADSASKVWWIEAMAKFVGKYEFLSFGYLVDKIVSFACDDDRLFVADICQNLLFRMTGSNPRQLNEEFLPVILAHTPAGTSVFTITHYLQEIASGNFQRYDYGTRLNRRVYNSSWPPHYDLGKVTTPVALLYSENDWLAAPKDVRRLQSELPNVVYSKIVEDPMFTHLDFVWAIDADKLVYAHVLDLLAKF